MVPASVVSDSRMIGTISSVDRVALVLESLTTFETANGTLPMRRNTRLIKNVTLFSTPRTTRAKVPPTVLGACAQLTTRNEYMAATL